MLYSALTMFHTVKINLRVRTVRLQTGNTIKSPRGQAYCTTRTTQRDGGARSFPDWSIFVPEMLSSRLLHHSAHE